MWTRRPGSVVLTMLALLSSVGRGDDSRKSAPENPEPGFLEFLGSVDRLADVNPDYLSQSGHPQAAKPPAKSVVAPPPPSQPPPAGSE